MAISVMFIFVLSLIATIIFFWKHQTNYWKRKNVPYIPASFPFGNFKGAGKQLHTSTIIQKYYNILKEQASPIGGLFIFCSPVALALDLDLIKHIFIKDFNYFQHRGIYYNEQDDPLSAHLVTIRGNKWRNLRTKLTPTFTSGKMKCMFPSIVKVADELAECVSEQINGNTEIELKELLARFTTDIIGTCAFGIDCNSLKDPNAEFRMMGKRVFEVPFNSVIKRLFINSSQKFAKFLHFKSFEDQVSKFFLGIVKETVEYREKHDVKRNDFMNLLIQLKNDGAIDGGSTMENLTLNEVAAQAFVFFLAGFETSSTLMSFCLYELALHPNIQQKVRDEVNAICEKYGGKWTYECMSDMKYVDQVLNESLRKYPPISTLPRMVTKDYRITDSNIILKEGTRLMIPIYAIHHDSQYYQQPEKFDPNRFSEEEIKHRNPFAFLPFGEGPRNCIGLRFGMMQARIGLATIVRNFEFSLASRSDKPLDISKSATILSINGGLWLNMRKVADK